MAKRAAIYARVLTDKQTVENQLRELRQIAERRGWEVVEKIATPVAPARKAASAAPAWIRCSRMPAGAVSTL